LSTEERSRLAEANTETARTLQGFINAIEEQIAAGRKQN
jgi:hypothetical protein